MDAQTSRDERLAVAGDVIENSGTIEAVKIMVAELHARYLDTGWLCGKNVRFTDTQSFDWNVHES